jgi:hypothetical protein
MPIDFLSSLTGLDFVLTVYPAINGRAILEDPRSPVELNRWQVAWFIFENRPALQRQVPGNSSNIFDNSPAINGRAIFTDRPTDCHLANSVGESGL